LETWEKVAWCVGGCGCGSRRMLSFPRPAGPLRHPRHGCRRLHRLRRRRTPTRACSTRFTACSSSLETRLGSRVRVGPHREGLWVWWVHQLPRQRALLTGEAIVRGKVILMWGSRGGGCSCHLKLLYTPPGT